MQAPPEQRRPGPWSWSGLGWWWGPVGLYLSAIFFLSSQSQPLPTGFSLGGYDKLAHFVEYAILGALMCRAWGRGGEGMPPARALGLTVLLATLWGVGDEIHQAFTPGRDADPMDVVADFLGSSSGAGAWFWRLRRQAAPARHPGPGAEKSGA